MGILNTKKEGTKMEEQTQREILLPEWIEDAKRRGEAIVKESEKLTNQLDRHKKAAIVNEDMATPLEV